MIPGSLKGLTVDRKVIERNRILGMLLGAFVYAFFMNIFIIPARMYSGGFMGLSQIIRTVLVDFAGLNLGQNDIAGIINLCLNVPLFIVASKIIGGRYIFRTILCMIFETLFLTIIPIPDVMLMQDQITTILIGGIGTGVGAGITLRSGAGGGGTDLLGAIIIKKVPNVSMSIVQNSFNVLVYGIMLAMFDVSLVVYSAIYSVIYALTVDKVFSQNINVEVHVITSPEFVKEMEQEILKSLERGITRWESVGAYTGNDKVMLYILTNKYELSNLRAIVRKHDSQALVIENIGVRINGNFEKRVQ